MSNETSDPEVVLRKSSPARSSSRDDTGAGGGDDIGSSLPGASNAYQRGRLQERDARASVLASDELLMLVLSYVPPSDLLQRASLTSRRFRNATLRDVALWESLVLPRINNKAGDSIQVGNGNRNRLHLTLHQMQRYWIFTVAAAASAEGQPSQRWVQALESPMVPRYLEYGSLLLSKAVALSLRRDGVGRVCLASSTEHETEVLEKVLSDPLDIDGPIINPFAAAIFGDLRRRQIRSGWWSSRPAPGRDTDETLLFATQKPDALISDVCIKPLLDPYDGGKTYTWKSTVIRAYQLGPESFLDSRSWEAEMNMHGFDRDAAPNLIQTSSSGLPQNVRGRRNLEALVEPDQDTIERLLAGQAPVYESPVLPGPTNSSWQVHSLQMSPVFANIITITLVGKNHRQYDTSGFYSCVDRVSVRGIPLPPNPPTPAL